MSFLSQVAGDALKTTAGVMDGAANIIEGKGPAGLPTSQSASQSQGSGGGEGSSIPPDQGVSSHPPADLQSGGTQGVSPVPKPSEESDWVRVNFCAGKDIERGFYIKLARVTRNQNDLTTFRTRIAGVLETKEFAHLHFCTQQGAIIPDDCSIKDYITECLETKIQDGQVLDMYMKMMNDKPKMVGEETTGQNLVPSQSKYQDAATLSMLKQNTPDENAFKMLTGTYYKYTAELEEQEWSVVAENNDLCYGTSIIRRQKDGKTIIMGVERARYPAFRLKNRPIMSNKLTSTSVKDVEVSLRIPDFMIDDQSYVSSFQCKSDLQSSLANSSFSEWDVEASVGASAFGCTVSASASYKKSSSSDVENSKSSSKGRLTLAYNFPRVTVFLDEGSLEMTAQCQADIKQVNDASSLEKFLDNYGEFFSTRVQLGGRLFASTDIDSETTDSRTKTESSMKTAASASFSGWGVSASVNTSYGSGGSQVATNASSSSTTTLTWQANGGDTLLCNNPPAWCPSVSDYYYWRSTKKDKVLHMVETLAKFPAQQNLPQNMILWQQQRTRSLIKATPFYLSKADGDSGADGSPVGGYLVSSQTSPEKTIYDASLAHQLFYGGDVSNIPPRANYSSMNTPFLGPKQRSRDYQYLAMEVEDSDGYNVEEICFETPYYLRNKHTSRYISYDDGFSYFLHMAYQREHLMLFRAPGDTKLQGPISNEASVTIVLLKQDNMTEKDFVVLSTEDTPDEFLMVRNSHFCPKDQKPAILKLTIKGKPKAAVNNTPSQVSKDTGKMNIGQMFNDPMMPGFKGYQPTPI